MGNIAVHKTNLYDFRTPEIYFHTFRYDCGIIQNQNQYNLRSFTKQLLPEVKKKLQSKT